MHKYIKIIEAILIKYDRIVAAIIIAIAIIIGAEIIKSGFCNVPIPQPY